MAFHWKARIATGAALAVAVVGYLASGVQAPTGAARAEEPVKAARNTGSPAGPGFLIDFTRRQDRDSHYLADYEMDEEWIKIVYRSNNIRFDREGMALSLLRTRGAKLPVSGAEYQRNGTYGYGRYEVVMTAAEGHGAVSSFFTYTGAHFGDVHDEIDFEFVAKTPRHVHLNHFKHGEDHAIDVPLWFDTTKADHLYAFEWAPNSIRWYVDGVKIHEVTEEIPSASGRVVANIWAGTGTASSWTGEPRFNLTTAKYRCMSHVPIGQKGPQCSDTFKAPPKPVASN